MATVDVTQDNVHVVPTNTLQQIQTVAINPTNNTNELATAVQTINTALTDDDAANAPTAVHTALTGPDNFAFIDTSVKVSGNIPGDKFTGATPGVLGQFIDLTPDNLAISAITPNQFIKTDSGNDIALVTSGRNIFSAGSGANTLIGGTSLTGSDTFIGDVRAANTVNQFTNFHTGDDLVITGLITTDFHYTIKDSSLGLEIDTTPTVAGKFASIEVLSGYTVADVGTKLSVGFSTTPTGVQYMFVHGNATPTPIPV